MPSTFFCGIWGLLATSVFSSYNGLIFPSSENRGVFLAVTLLGIAAIIIWCAGTSFIYFLIAKKLGCLRVELTVEILGLDASYLGEFRAKSLVILREHRKALRA